jgi:hypothetical protein
MRRVNQPDVLGRKYQTPARAVRRMLRVSQPFANHTDQMIMAVAMTIATFTTTKTAARKVSRFASVFRFRGSGRFVGILEP